MSPLTEGTIIVFINCNKNIRFLKVLHKYNTETAIY